MQLARVGLAPTDVKLDNMVVNVSRLAGGQGPLLKLVDCGMASIGTAIFCYCFACCAVAVCQLVCVHQACATASVMHW